MVKRVYSADLRIGTNSPQSLLGTHIIHSLSRMAPVGIRLPGRSKQEAKLQQCTIETQYQVLLSKAQLSRLAETANECQATERSGMLKLLLNMSKRTGGTCFSKHLAPFTSQTSDCFIILQTCMDRLLGIAMQKKTH